MIDRKAFLQGISFTSLGAVAGHFVPRTVSEFRGLLKDRAAAAAPVSPWKPAPLRQPDPSPPALTPPAKSYAQAGEDRIVSFIFAYLQNREALTYLDIGAYHPTQINNTYLFYEHGSTGVLVEPNVDICKLLREVRPNDTVLEAGIGITAQREADYYRMTEPSWNTFSKEEAEHQEKVTNGRIRIREVVKMPLLDINQVMAEHFDGKAPAYVSIDAEGIHFEILKSIDFSRFRPKVICIESLVSGTARKIPEIGEFMKAKNYVERGATFVNSIFVDQRLLDKYEDELNKPVKKG